MEVSKKTGTLNESMDLRSGGDASDWLCLAMAHWQLGDEQQAAHWYDRAAEWMDNNPSDDAELRGFRAEADDLLGLNEERTLEEQAGPYPNDGR